MSKRKPSTSISNNSNNSNNLNAIRLMFDLHTVEPGIGSKISNYLK
jgi:hypothetical protein